MKVGIRTREALARIKADASGPRGELERLHAQLSEHPATKRQCAKLKRAIDALAEWQRDPGYQ